MSVSRIKTIAIAALLLINTFFGILIIWDTAADARSERQAIENVCAVVSSGGVMIDPDAVILSGAIRTMRTAREGEAEAQIAQAVLGRTTMTDHGVIYLYENDERGTAEFYSAGDFEIRLNEGVITNENGTLRTVQGLLRDMKFETASQVVSLGQGSETVSAVSAYKGASIFNCATEFIFVGGSLQTIKGRYVAGIEPLEDGAAIMQVGTALLGFLAWVRRGNSDCTQIDKIEAGYQYGVSGMFGEGVLVPAWLVTTDAGRYIIDDATGEIWAVS